MNPFVRVKERSPMTGAEFKDNQHAVVCAIDQLPENTKRVLSLYYNEELTPTEIGEVLNLAEHEVSQIHSEAIESIRATLLAEKLADSRKWFKHSLLDKFFITQHGRLAELKLSQVLIDLFNLLQGTKFSGLNPDRDAIGRLRRILNVQSFAFMGRTVSAVRKSIQVENGRSDDLFFELSTDAESVCINTYNLDRDKVVTLDLGAMSAGEHKVSWDGKNDQGIPVDDGFYPLEITALNSNGKALETIIFMKGKVDRIDYQCDTVHFVVKNRAIPVENVIGVNEG